MKIGYYLMQYFPIVLFPLPLLPPSFPPDPLTLCLSLEKRLLRDSNETWQNKILQNEAKTFILTLDRATQQEENNPKSKKSQRPTHNHSQESQKNAKLIAIVCMQRTWCKSYAYCFHLCDLLGILLNTEVPVPLVPQPLWLLQSFCLLFYSISWALRRAVWWRPPIWTLSLHIMSGCSSLHLFLSATRGSFSCAYWMNYWSMTIAEYL